MKRIILFTENLGSGGAEHQLVGLAVLLQQRGYIVEVLTYIERQFHAQYLKDNGVQQKLNHNVSKKFFGLFYLCHEIKNFSPDTIISFLPAPNIRMCIMRFFLRFNLIVSERSHTQCWNLKNKTKYLLYIFADHVVANSVSELENIIVHCPWLKSKSCSISNFVDAQKFQPNYNASSNRILCVGRLIPSKNVLRLLDVIDILVKRGFDLHLTWVGDQYDISYLAAVRTKISKLDLCSYVLLKGQTTDVVKEYQKANIFCFPSLYEGYPNVLIEAMSCGLPVVCSNVCEMPHVVSEGVNGFLFNPLDTDDMADAITKMLRLSHEERKTIGLCNRRKIVENNSKDIFVDRYISIL